jgi:pimeloyl-ACP methyl ester carboxylesterase
MQTAPAGTCARHRRRERVATCGVCGSDLCVDCVVHTAVGIKCRGCTGGAAATAPTASRAAKEAKAARAKAARTKAGSGPRAGRARGAGGAEAPSPGTGFGEEGRGPGRRPWAIPLALVGVVAILGAAVGLLLSAGDGDGGGATSGQATEEETGNTTSETVERVADFVGAGGLELGATLTIPPGVGVKKAPGVVIVPGGATLDRNGLITQVQQTDPLYEDLSKSLAQAGIVSLRYDLRGTGASKLPEGTGKSFEDLVVDAKSALDFLAARRETQGAPLGLVAYDNGGFVAMSLAAADARVKGMVLISTPGRPLVDVLAEDFGKEVADQAEAQALADAIRAAAAQLVSTGQVPRPETLPPALQPVFPARDAAYLKGLFSFSPVAEAQRVQIPTLVVRGGTDTSITDEDVISLRSNLARGEQLIVNAGNTLALPPGQEGALHNPARHGSVRAPEATDAINAFLKRHLPV